MKTMRQLKWTVVGAVAACGVLAALQGCELIVSFDRSKIPSDSGFEEDVTISDGGEDASDAEPGTDATTGGGDAGDATTTASDAASDAQGDGSVPEGAASGDDAADVSTGAMDTGMGPDDFVPPTPDAGEDATMTTTDASGAVDTGTPESGTVSEASTPAEAGPTDSSVAETGSSTDASLDAPAE